MQSDPPKEPPARTARLGFPKQARLRSRAEFDRVLKHGVRVADGRVTLWAIATDQPHARLGMVIGRKHGNSPQRNRLKRLLREAFRLHRLELPPSIDFAVSVRPGQRISLREVEESLLALVASAVRRLNRK